MMGIPIGLMHIFCRDSLLKGGLFPLVMSKPLMLVIILLIPMLSGCLGEIAAEPEPEPEAQMWVDQLFSAAMRLNPNATYDIWGNDGWTPSARVPEGVEQPSMTWGYPVAGEADVPANETLFCTYFVNSTDSRENCQPAFMGDNTFWRSLYLEPSGWNTSCMVLAKVPDDMTMEEVDDGLWREDWKALLNTDIANGQQPSWCSDYY